MGRGRGRGLSLGLEGGLVGAIVVVVVVVVVIFWGLGLGRLWRGGVAGWRGGFGACFLFERGGRRVVGEGGLFRGGGIARGRVFLALCA